MTTVLKSVQSINKQSEGAAAFSVSVQHVSGRGVKSIQNLAPGSSPGELPSRDPTGESPPGVQILLWIPLPCGSALTGALPSSQAPPPLLRPLPPPLGDLAVAAGAALGGALGGPDGLVPLQAVALGAGGAAGQRVRASVHHDGVHPVGHGERLQVGLDGHRQRQLVDEVDRSAGDDGPAAQVLQSEDWDTTDRSTLETQDRLNTGDQRPV